MLEFQNLQKDNWHRYEESVLQSESVYPEAIRTPAEEFVYILEGGDAIAIVALLDSHYVGNIIGFTLDRDELGDYGMGDVPSESEIVYLFSFVINPQYQGMGYGYRLLEEFMREARARGYRKVIGHFRPNNSLHLIKKFGAEEKGVYRDWIGSGEDYLFCCLDLNDASERTQQEHSDVGFSRQIPELQEQDMLPGQPAVSIPEVSPIEHQHDHHALEHSH
jgi:GNAT superfamily N-acetyltransferase